ANQRLLAPARVSSRIVTIAVAAEVTRRKWFSRPDPPPYVGGYYFDTPWGLWNFRPIATGNRHRDHGSNHPGRLGDYCAASIRDRRDEITYHPSSFAFIVTFAFNKREIGQPALAASAVAVNFAGSIPGILAVTSKCDSV